MDVLRTPEERFEGLLDYPFTPHYRHVTADDGTDLRFHYVDEGPRSKEAVLLLHGNPTWSYLYRHMITALVARGHRVVAPDLMGMGKSDKPDDPAFYTMARHTDWLSQWLSGLDADSITMFCQDWGGILGFHLLPVHGERFYGVIASNTGLPTGEGMNTFMADWLAFSQSVEELPVAKLVASGTSRRLSKAELAAYDAPYPDGTYQASPKQFPLLIPLQPDNPGVPQAEATWRYLETFEKPFLTVFGSEDDIGYRSGAHRRLQKRIPGAKDQPHRVIEGAKHFIQEDAGDELVTIIDAFTKGTL